jgi:hypothetical protein
MFRTSLSCVAIAALLGGCASAPLSFLNGVPLSRAGNALYPVQVIAIDGELAFSSPDNPVNIAPGVHLVRLVLASEEVRTGPSMLSSNGPKPSSPGAQFGKWEMKDRSVRRTDSQDIYMKIEPCTRYYLGAARETALAHAWQLVVDAKEPVAGCDPAAELKKAQAPSGAASTPKAG